MSSSDDPVSQVVPFPGARSVPPPDSPLSDPRVHQVFLVLASILVLFARLWETTLSSYDDAFYAEKAKEILLTGEWLVPHWAYEPSFDNTPLYFWITAVLFKLFGVTEFVARFTSAAAGVGCVFLTYRFGRRLFGPWVGLFSGLALLTTPYFIKYSRHAMVDTTQTLLVGASLYLLLLGLERQRTGWIDLGAGALMGLAVLNKSLLGYLPLPIYFTYVLAARVPWRRALRPGVGLAVLAGVLLPGAWFAAATAEYGTPFLERHFGYILWHRAVSGDPGHVESWSERLGYVTGLFMNFQPWIFFAVYGAWKLYRRIEDPRRGLVPVAWAGAVIGLLSFAAVRKSWYIMPAFPALAILAGIGLHALVRRSRERVAAGIALLIGAYILVACCTPIRLGRDRNRDIADLAPMVRQAVPHGGKLLNFRLDPYWRYSTALYYYADRGLTMAVEDWSEIEAQLATGEAEAVLTNRADALELERNTRLTRVLATSGDLVLLTP